MSFDAYYKTITSDLFRYCGRANIYLLIKYLFLNPGFKYTFLMRTSSYLKHTSRLLCPFYVIFRLLLRHYEYKYGISIPYNTVIGYGLYIGHFGGIVVHHEVTIGNNCNINHDVTIGAAYGGRFPGVPTIGDNVFIGPGAKIIGGITIENNVAVGSNCVVTTSIPENAVVVGIPGLVKSFKGSGHYVVNTVAERFC